MIRAPTKFVRRLAILGAAVAIHAVLLHMMASEQIVAKLFAAGGSAIDVAIALAFLTLRLGLYLLAPGLLLFTIGDFVVSRLSRSPDASLRGMKSAADGDGDDRRGARRPA